jgi:large subunit ribosomal protein LP0
MADETKEAPPLSKRKQRKARYRSKLEKCLETFNKCLLVGVDNVGSRQMQAVRMALRGQAELLMGKNTIVRLVLRQFSEKNPSVLALLPFIRGNTGFVFTNGDLAEIRKVVAENKVPAAAKAGTIAPADVYVPPGPTGLDPGQTSFFQALNIATKIARGSIEILTQVHLIREGEKVGSSAVALLSKLNIQPFFYGMKVSTVYENGTTYDAKILDINQSDLFNKFMTGVRNVAALSMAVGIPTAAAAPHMMMNAYKKVLALSLATDYTFEEAKIFKVYLENPELLAAAKAGAAGGAEKEEEAEAEEEDEEAEKSSEGQIGGGLFGDD